VVIRPEKISLGEKGLVRGRVEETIYIGTDTRFIIRLNDKTSVTVREQNLYGNQIEIYRKGDEVGLVWNPSHALVLTE
jgi:spermidine/putrescine transport system ATP-binding protein